MQSTIGDLGKAERRKGGKAGRRRAQGTGHRIQNHSPLFLFPKLNIFYLCVIWNDNAKQLINVCISVLYEIFLFGTEPILIDIRILRFVYLYFFV